MKLNQVVFARANGNSAGGGGSVVVEAPKVETPPVEVEPIRFDFAGTKGISLDGLAKLERDWHSTQGRIKAAVKSQCETNEGLSLDEKRKVANKTVTNALLENVLTVTPAQVGRLASELVKAGKLSQGDASLWIAYVQLASAFAGCRTIGKL